MQNAGVQVVVELAILSKLVGWKQRTAGLQEVVKLSLVESIEGGTNTVAVCGDSHCLVLLCWVGGAPIGIIPSGCCVSR